MATARIALPVSVSAMISHSAKATKKTSPKGNDPWNGEEGKAKINALKTVGKIDGARVGVKGVEKRVLDEHSKPQRYQQHVAVVAMRSRADDEPLQRVAEREESGREQQRGLMG